MSSIICVLMDYPSKKVLNIKDMDKQELRISINQAERLIKRLKFELL